MIEPMACTPASGWEKGQVENQVGRSAGPLLQAAAEVHQPGGAERLAGSGVPRAGRDMHPHPEQARSDGAPRRSRPSGRRCSRSLAPFDGFHEIEQRCSRHLPDQLRPQPLLGDGQGGAADGAGPRLRRPDRGALRRRGGGRSRPLLRPGPDRSTIPGITCRSWPGSPAPCATARRSRTGTLPPALTRLQAQAGPRRRGRPTVRTRAGGGARSTDWTPSRRRAPKRWTPAPPATIVILNILAAPARAARAADHHHARGPGPDAIRPSPTAPATTACEVSHAAA